MDNGGKTSILLLLNKKFSLLNSTKPTFKAKISSQPISLLGLQISNWDLGGQKNYREAYLEKKGKYFTDVRAIFYVIDVQNPQRFDEALSYLKGIIDALIELNTRDAQILVLFHKYDPDLKKNSKISEQVKNLKEKIRGLTNEISMAFYETSIYDEASLLKAFSEGVILVSDKAKSIHTLLKEYMGKSFNSAALLLDKHSFIIASRTTDPEYQEICEAIAPRLTRAMEKLEDWNINTVDIVTNIEFPTKQKEGQKEGIIFLRKLDINEEERLYIISLCLNKRVKVKSYDYLPILVENLKNLLESFEY